MDCGGGPLLVVVSLITLASRSLWFSPYSHFLFQVNCHSSARNYFLISFLFCLLLSFFLHCPFPWDMVFYLVISALVIWCSPFFMVHTCRILFIVIFPWFSLSRFISMFWEMSFTKYDIVFMVIIIFHWCRSRTYLHLAVWCRFHDSVVFIHCQFIMLHHFFHVSLFSIVTSVFMVTVICTKYCLPCDSFPPLCMQFFIFDIVFMWCWFFLFCC